MRELNDGELLAVFANADSQEAFATLVERHVSMVYCAARRQVSDPSLAEEVTQAVFIILARKARSLGGRISLSGWLCRTAHFAARNARKAEYHRQQREQLAAQMDNVQDDAWNQFSPLLDEAVAQLSEMDREAIVLRFYQGKSLQEVGDALSLNADTAQKRVARALERLRKFFAKRGVVFTTAAIGVAISAYSVQSAPATLAKSVTTTVIAKSAATTGSTFMIVKGVLAGMAWTKMKTAILTTAAVAALVTPMVWQGLKNAGLNRQLVSARDENHRLLAQAPDQKSLPVAEGNGEGKDRALQNEILRLRGQVTRLQNEARRSDVTSQGASNTPPASMDANDPAAPFTITMTNRVANGHTLVGGGWSRSPGNRTFMLTTPEIMNDQNGSSARIVKLKFQIIEAPDVFWDQVGWSSLKTDSHASGQLGNELTADQVKTVLDTKVYSTDGTGMITTLNAPMITTGDGIEATMTIGDTTNAIVIGVTPKIDPNGQYVDLQMGSRFSPGAEGK